MRIGCVLAKIFITLAKFYASSQFIEMGFPCYIVETISFFSPCKVILVEKLNSILRMINIFNLDTMQ